MAVFATYEVLVDWSNNGNFIGPFDNITADVRKMQWRMGRDFASEVTGKSIAGSARISLDNYEDKYSPFNTGSPITTNIVPGRPVRITMEVSSTKVTVWQGFLQNIIPRPAVTKRQARAELTATGPLGFINEGDANIPVQTDITTDIAIGLILDDANWPAGQRNLDTGITTMKFFLTGGKVKALFAARLAESTESGFFREEKNGDIGFENRQHRSLVPHITPQATYTNEPGGAIRYERLTHEDTLKEIFNRAKINVRNYATAGAESVLWTLEETGADSPAISAGTSLIFFATIDTSVTDIEAANPWTTPVPTTDFLANSQSDGLGTDLTGDMAIVVSKFDRSMKMTFTNNHGSLTAFMTFMQARGLAFTKGQGIGIIVEDAASIAKYGKRTFPLPGRFVPTSAEARTHAQNIIDQRKDPVPIVNFTMYANKSLTHLAEARDRDISDRIIVVANEKIGLFINSAMYIETMSHTVEGNGVHRMTIGCNPVGARGGNQWNLGVSTLGITTELVF